ncbi:hypothetical protein GGI35DRAFT_479682 [Trichoderma velutinum]
MSGSGTTAPRSRRTIESRLRTSQRPPDHSTNVYGLNNMKNHGIRIVHAARPESSPSNKATTATVPGSSIFHPYMVNSLALKIKSTRCPRGLGVFTTHSFARFHRIVYEQPIFSCFHPAQKNVIGWRKEADGRWRSLSVMHQKRFKSQFAKIEYMPLAKKQLLPHESRDFLSFLLEYSFNNPQGSMIHVYHFASHINHACHKCANAEVWIQPEAPHTITIRLLRKVKKSREIFISYNRPSGNTFGCAICGIRDGETSRFKQLWHGMVRRARGVRSIRHQSGQGPTAAQPCPTPSANTTADAPATVEAQADVDVSEAIVESAAAEAPTDANTAADVEAPADMETAIGDANSPEMRRHSL